MRDTLLDSMKISATNPLSKKPRKKSEVQKPVVVGDIARVPAGGVSMSRVINLKKKLPAIQVNMDQVKNWWFAHQHKFFVITAVLVGALILSSFSTGHASVATFHPSTCLGDWEKAENATGEPSVPPESSAGDFSLENSARMPASVSSIYCGGFKGEIPQFTTPTAFKLTLSWSVEGQETETDSATEDIFDVPVGGIVIPAPEEIPTEEVVVPGVETVSFFKRLFTQTVFAQESEPVPAEEVVEVAQETVQEPAQQDTESVPTEEVSDVEEVVSVEPINTDEQDEVAQEETPADAFMQVEYTLDGTTWKSLGVVGRSEWARASFDIPLEGWENLDNLQVALKALPTFDTPPVVYLDAMSIDVEYTDMAVEGTPPTVMIDNDTDFVNGKKDFTSTETVTFELTTPDLTVEELKTLVDEGKATIVKDTAGVLGDTVHDPLITSQVEESVDVIKDAAQETKELIESVPTEITPPPVETVSLIKKLLSPATAYASGATVAAVVVDSQGQMTDIVVQVVTDPTTGKRRVEVEQPREFRPGVYTVRVTFTTPTAIIVSTQDFSWGVLAINFNKSVYVPGDDAYIQMGVLNEGGHTICDADLDLRITTPTGAVNVLSTDDESIVRAPECGPNNVISVPDYYAHYIVPDVVGTYELTLTAQTANGTKSITDAFVVQASEPYSIERVGPSRIYPVALYPMTLRVRATDAWSGTITEQVPESFEISQPQQSMPYESVSVANDVKTISWNVSLLPGQEVFLGYYFDAPDVSPEFYILGKAAFVDSESTTVFTESRNWQIASDAACNATGSGTWSATANFLNCTGAASGGAGTGLRPGPADALTINSGVALTVDTTATITSLAFAASTAATSVTVNNGVTFTVTGTTTISSPGAAGTNTITVGGGTSGIFSTAGLSIPGSSTAGRFSTLTLSAGGTFTSTSGITFSGTAAQSRFTNSSAATINLTGTMSTGGTVTINSGTTLNTTGTVTLSRATTFGILNVNSGTTTMGGVAIAYAGLVTVASGATLTTSSATGTKTFSAGITVNSTGVFDLLTGSNFAAVTSFGGNITANGTTFRTGSGTVTLTGTGTRTISGSGNATLGGTVTIPTNMTLTNSNTGTVTMGALTLASPTAANGLSLTTASTTNITGAVTYTANATANAQTITMNGTANITAGSLLINRPTSTGQSNITCAGGATGTFATTGAASINGANTATATVNVLMNTCNFTSGGLLTIAGGTTGGNITFTTTTGVLTAGAGITFSGTTARNVLNVGSGNFNLVGTLGSGGTLTIDSANTLFTTGTAAISGAYTIQNFTVSSGTTTLNNVAITFAGNTTVSGSLVAASAVGLKTFTGPVTVNAGGSFNLSAVATVTRFDNNITVDPAGTFNSGTGTVTIGTSLSLLGAGNISLGGTVTISSGVTLTNSNTGTVTMGALTLASPTAANGLSLTTASTTNITGAVTYTANATANAQTITMNGTANITAGSLLINRPTSTGQSNITCAASATGTFTVNGGAGVSLQGANNGVTGSINLSMKDCNFTASAAQVVWGGVNGGGLIDVSFDAGTLTVGAGVSFVGSATVNKLTMGPNSTLNLTGTIPALGGLTIDSTNTLVSTGTSTINGPYTFGKVEIPSGTLSLGGAAITFANTVTIDGTLNSVTSATGTKTFNSMVTINPGGVFDMSPVNPVTSFAGGITMNGTTFNSGTAATVFSATQDIAGSTNMSFGGAVTISSGVTLTNNNTGTVNFTSSVTGGNASSTFATGSGSTSEFDSTVMSTGLLVPSTSANTVIYGGGTQTIKIPTTNPYYNLTISTAGVKSLAASTTVSNALSITAGSLDTVNGSNFPLIVKDITIGASGTLLGQGSTITVTGNWSNSGVFTAGTSTVLMNGGATVTVSGNTTFANLTITHTSAKQVNFQTAGSPTFAITGLFTVTGSLGQPIKLYSDASPTQWTINPTGTASVDYVDVQDSACGGGSIAIMPGNFTNSGNNGTCWLNASITFSISDASIGFGALSSSAARFATGDTVGDTSETEAHTIVVSTTAPSGYTLSVRGDSLTKTGHTIAAIGGVNTASSTGTEQFGLRMTATGGSGTVSAPYAASGFAYDATSSAPSAVASATTGDGVATTYSARYMCNIAAVTPAGSYATDLTYVVTGNF